jgi:FkbM family methyltransferase
MREPRIKSTGKLYPKTKNYYQKILVRKLFGKRLYKYFKVFKILLLYKIGKSFEISKFLKKIIFKDFVILDIGANLGQYSIRLSYFAPEGRIISVEPVYDNYEYLLKIKKKYKLNNLECYNYAVSDYAGKGILYVPIIDNDIELDTRATIDKNNYYFDYSNYKTQNVNVITLNNISDNLKLNRIDIIKSDTEGNDNKVILGSLDLIKKYLPLLLIEDSHKAEWVKIIYGIGYLPFYVSKKCLLKNAFDTSDDDNDILFDLLVLIHTSKLGNFQKYLVIS